VSDVRYLRKHCEAKTIWCLWSKQPNRK